MLSEKAKILFEKLNMPYPAIALKYHCCRPKTVAKYEGEPLAFCSYVAYAQAHEGSFYIEAAQDACYGKMVLGMVPKPPVTASGQAGEDFEVFRTAACNRHLYQHLPVVEPGTVNYVQFARVQECDFEPDLIMCVCDYPSADVLLHATSYMNGDFWESKSSPVISCAWMYAYPVISGKVNHITTGFYHGLRRRKAYPAGLTMISIPFQKIREVVDSLEEMPWTTIAFREDEESKAELKRRMVHWQEMALECECTVDLK